MSFTDDTVKSFLEYLLNIKRCSIHTVKSYELDLRQAQTFFQQAKLETWEAVTPVHLRNFLKWHAENKSSPKTIHRKLSALKSFYKFCIKQGQITSNPCASIRGPKSPQSLPKPLDIDQMRHLLSTQETTFLAIRDAAILEILYSCGLRISELLSLTLGDLDVNTREIRIQGKGNKQRIGILGREATIALERWLICRQSCLTQHNPALFVTKQGKKLSARAIQIRLLNLGISKGILSRVHPHRLRHSFASHLLESSQDLRAVQELLGHSNLASTQIYTKVNFQSLANVYDQCHPRAYTKKFPKIKKEQSHEND